MSDFEEICNCFSKNWRETFFKNKGKKVPISELRSLINSARLSEAQVYELCASARNWKHDDRDFDGIYNTADESLYLTFGEFCACYLMISYRGISYSSRGDIFWRRKEDGGGLRWKRRYGYLGPKPAAYDLFLGGSCNPTTWRRDEAIPYLKSNNITYYNPQRSDWSPDLIDLEHKAKESSKILFFVLNEQTRNVVSMIELAYLSGIDWKELVVTIRAYGDNPVIDGHKISKEEISHLTSGLRVVFDLIERRNDPVFTEIEDSLYYAKGLLDNRKTRCFLTKQREQNISNGRVVLGDVLPRFREAYETIDVNGTQNISLEEVRMANRILFNRDFDEVALKKIKNVCYPEGGFDFDRFCCIVTDYGDSSSIHYPSAYDVTSSSNVSKMTNSLNDENRCRSFASMTSRFCQMLVNPFSKFAHRFLPLLPQEGDEEEKGKKRNSKSESKRTTNPQPPSTSSSTSTSSTRSIPSFCDLRRGTFRPIHRDVHVRSTPFIDRDIIYEELKKSGLTFYSPEYVKPRLTPMELAIIDNTKAHLFCIDNRSYTVREMCEAAFCIGKGYNVILCIQPVDKEIFYEHPGGKDYERGRQYLSDIANRKGVPVFAKVKEAVDCLIQKCKETSAYLE